MLRIDGFRRTFTSDGKLYRGEDGIGLILIERPEQIIEKWVNMFFNNWDKMVYSGLGVFDSKEEAEADATEPFDKGVKCLVRYIGATKIYIKEN